MVVENNDKVSVHYTGKLDDGTVFDSSEGREALEFVIGKGMVVPGFEKGIVGMEEGSEKTIEIESKDAYGPEVKELVQEVPRASLPAEITPEVGMMLSASAPNGQMVPVKVVEVNDENLKLDMNHPLAGKKLTFKVKLEKITKAGDFKELKEEKKKEEDCSDDDCSSCSSCAGH